MHGKFFWYDIMTTDMKASEKFYADVVGWGARDSGVPGQQYTLLTVNGTPVAGLIANSGRCPQSGGSPLLDGVYRSGRCGPSRCAAPAGRREGPSAAYGCAGRYPFLCRCRSSGRGLHHCQGAWRCQAGSARRHAGDRRWRELYALEWRTAFEFYAKMFGWTKAEAIDMGPMGTYQLFATGDDPVGGIMTKPEAIPMPYWGYYFNVEGIDAAAARVTGGGGSILNGPMQVPGGQWIVQCVDPQGAVFNLVALKR